MSSNAARRVALPIAALFGVLYFIQGIIEPTTGLVSQPLQSQWLRLGLSPGNIGLFLLWIAIPWSLKPLFGLLSDFCPLLGSRRRSYLIAAASLTAAAFLWLYATPATAGALRGSLIMLMLATLGVAFADVVLDALSVEVGQPLGITGQLQSIQWAAGSAALLLLGSLGGWLDALARLDIAYAACLALSLAACVAAVALVREPPCAATERATFTSAWRALGTAARSPLVLLVGGFLFLWGFNPLSGNVLQHYLTQELQLGEQFFGHTISIQAAAQIAACLVYGWLSPRVSVTWLAHGSIASGILATIAYWGVYDRGSAVAVSILVGFTYALGSLIQIDLAARVCPVESAGTVFALLMAISNTGLSLSGAAGGPLYDHLAAQFGSRHVAFDWLVAAGAASTAGCWLFVPLLRRHLTVG